MSSTNEPPELAWLRQWLASADTDLRAAEHLLASGEDDQLPVACFHAQQSAEKHLKAILIHLSREIPRIHDLRHLAQLVAEAFASQLVDAAEILPLNRYAVETRYPGFWEPIDEAEAREALALARKVSVAVRKALSAVEPVDQLSITHPSTEES